MVRFYIYIYIYIYTPLRWGFHLWWLIVGNPSSMCCAPPSLPPSPVQCRWKSSGTNGKAHQICHILMCPNTRMPNNSTGDSLKFKKIRWYDTIISQIRYTELVKPLDSSKPCRPFLKWWQWDSWVSCIILYSVIQYIIGHSCTVLYSKMVSTQLLKL